MQLLVSLISIIGLTVLAAHWFRWPLFRAAIRVQRGKAGLRERVATVDGHDIVFLDGGRGEPLILLHGFGANKDNWIQIAPLLAPYYRLIIPDLPGFGDSTRDDSKNYGAAAQLERLRLFVAQLGFDSVHIGGNSMGGYLAGLYAARFPEAVKSQWLLAPAGVVAAEDSEFVRELADGENLLLINDVGDFNRLLEVCFTKPPFVPKIFQRCLYERNAQERDFNEKVFNDLFAEPLDLEHALKGSPVKTQVVWGDGDRILHCSGANILDAALPNAETIVMPRMGHCPMLERPRDTADHYLAFQGIVRT